MECVLLGSGGMLPMPGRFLTSVVVRLQGQLYLFDAGEGCQISLKKTKLGIKSLRLCRDVDLAFLGGMFLPEHHEEAEAKGHMTADDAARVAARAGARRAVIVHISSRYTEEDMGKFVDAAKKRFQNTEIGSDLKQFMIPYREEDPILPHKVIPKDI